MIFLVLGLFLRAEVAFLAFRGAAFLEVALLVLLLAFLAVVFFAVDFFALDFLAPVFLAVVLFFELLAVFLALLVDFFLRVGLFFGNDALMEPPL